MIKNNAGKKENQLFNNYSKTCENGIARGQKKKLCFIQPTFENGKL